MEIVGTKENLEKYFGTMSDEVYEIIAETVHDDMQQLVNYNVSPSRANFINILSTNTDFVLKYFADQFI